MVYRNNQRGKKALKKEQDYTMKWKRRKGGGATLTVRGKASTMARAYLSSMRLSSRVPTGLTRE